MQGLTVSADYVNIRMIRPDLRHVPYRPLPQGFSLRLYRPGDEDDWVRIWLAAERAIGLLEQSKVSRETFDKNFGVDLKGFAARGYFLISPDGRTIGTASAWYDYKHAGQHWGRLHWVAIEPEFQGKGLCKPMLTVVLNRMVELGHRRALLGTQTARLAAIKTYLDYGFEPDLAGPGGAGAWRTVLEKLPHTALKSNLLLQPRCFQVLRGRTNRDPGTLSE